MVYPVYPSAYHYNAVQHRKPQHGNQHSQQSNPNADEFQRQLGGRPPSEKPGADAGNPAVSAEQPAVQSTQKSMQGQPIGIDDIIHDVAGTMDALGADDTTRQEVGLYLAVIQHQATQANPNKKFVQESLKVIGTRLDTFIGEALKQPSTVVNEWVQALLLQPIEYRSHGNSASVPPTLVAAGSAAPINNAPTPAAATSVANADKPAPKVDVTAVLKEAKTVTQHNQPQQAVALLNTALANPALTPAQVGRLHFALGKVAESSDDWAAVKASYSAAVQHPLPVRRAVQAHGALANALEQLGDTDAALAHYQQALAAAPSSTAAGNTSRALAGTLAQLENDYGSLLYIQQGAQVAQPHFTNARQWAIKGNRQLLPDIYGNLAQVWQALNDPTQRNQAYLKGLNAAKKLGDQSSYLNLLAEYQQHVAA